MWWRSTVKLELHRGCEWFHESIVPPENAPARRSEGCWRCGLVGEVSDNATSGPVIGNINKEKKDDKAFNFTQEHFNASVHVWLVVEGLMEEVSPRPAMRRPAAMLTLNAPQVSANATFSWKLGRPQTSR